MNRTILFDSPFLLGFDHTRALIERAAKAAADWMGAVEGLVADAIFPSG